jgi:hypothetical protein
MKMEQSVPKRRHVKFRLRGITQKKTYDSLILFEKLLCVPYVLLEAVHRYV